MTGKICGYILDLAISQERQKSYRVKIKTQTFIKFPDFHWNIELQKLIQCLPSEASKGPSFILYLGEHFKRWLMEMNLIFSTAWSQLENVQVPVTSALQFTRQQLRYFEPCLMKPCCQKNLRIMIESIVHVTVSI